MEYIFGINQLDGKETLKTKSEEHTDLAGFQRTVREYSDCVITDSYLIISKIKSSEDTEGNCYDWYEIDKHDRMIDFSKAIKASIYDEMASAYNEGVQEA